MSLALRICATASSARLRTTSSESVVASASAGSAPLWPSLPSAAAASARTDALESLSAPTSGFHARLSLSRDSALTALIRVFALVLESSNWPSSAIRLALSACAIGAPTTIAVARTATQSALDVLIRRLQGTRIDESIVSRGRIWPRLAVVYRGGCATSGERRWHRSSDMCAATMEDRSFKLAVGGGAAALVVAIVLVRFCGALSVPAPPEPPAAPASTRSARDILTASSETAAAWHAFIEKDAKQAGIPI